MANPSLPLLNTLQQGLNFRTVDRLNALLKLLPVNPEGSRKAELVEAILDYMMGPGLKKVWQDLDEFQQAAVAETVHFTQGIYESEPFEAKYGEQPDWETRSSYGYRYNQPAAKLDLFFHPISSYGSVGVMPEDLRLKLKAFVPKPEPLILESAEQPPKHFSSKYEVFDYERRRPVQTSDEVPVVCCSTEQLAQRDLLAVLRLVHLGKVAVSDKTLMPSKASLKAIAPLIQGGDYYSETEGSDKSPDDEPIGMIKPFAWVMLLQAGGLAKLDNKKLQLTKAGQKAMGAAPAKTIKAIWKKWLKTTVLDELRRVDKIKGQTGKGKRGLTALSKRRAPIVDALKQCPLERWVEFEDIKCFMIANHQTFEVSRHPGNLRTDALGDFSEVEGTWSILQDTYMKCFLLEYAATLGLIDVAYISPNEMPSNQNRYNWRPNNRWFLSRYDGLLSFRINPLGAFCLELADAYAATAVTTDSRLRILPNLDLVMTGPPLGAAEQLMMETFTTQTSDAVWKLDRDVALKAAEAGHSLKEFQDFLLQVSDETLPKTVQQFFQDCRSRSESLQDRGMARLIECADATLAALIANDSRTKKYCQLAGKTYLVVAVDQEMRFRTGLRKLGYSLPLN